MEKRQFYRGYTGLFTGLTLAGALAVGWGASIDSDTAGNIMIAVGGALLGTATASLASTLSEADFLLDIKRVLSESLAPGLVTPDSMLGDHQNKYFNYMVSRVGGRRVWICTVIDFSASASAGRLSTFVKVPSPSTDVEEYYRTQAGFIDDRCIIIEEAVRGSESAAVFLYPSFSKNFRAVQSGIAVIETWDGTPGIVPTMISQTPLAGWEAPGQVGDSAVDELDHLWRSHCAGIGELQETLAAGEIDR